MFIYFKMFFQMLFFLGDALRILRNVHRQMWMWNGSSADVVSKNVLFKRALEAAKGQSDEWMRKRCWKLSCAVTKGALYLHVCFIISHICDMPYQPWINSLKHSTVLPACQARQTMALWHLALGSEAVAGAELWRSWGAKLGCLQKRCHRVATYDMSLLPMNWT